MCNWVGRAFEIVNNGRRKSVDASTDTWMRLVYLIGPPTRHPRPRRLGNYSGGVARVLMIECHESNSRLSRGIIAQKQ